jgi:uncharacterized membrane protein HdeD (DUF308 family)
MPIIASFHFDPEVLKRFSRQTLLAGGIMAAIGLLGLIFPPLMSLMVIGIMAWLLLLSAVVQGYITYHSYRHSFSAWLKPVMLLIAALLLLLFPGGGIAAVGMMLAAYLLVDAFSSITFAWSYRPHRGWWMMLINGLASLLLAVILLAGWPFSSMVTVGLLIGISLLFDGIALLTFGFFARRLGEDAGGF